MHPALARGERGIALVISMLVLLVVTILAVVLMSGVTVSRQVAGHDQRASAALMVAEAGINEAVARIRNGDADLDITKPNAVAQIFLANAGSVPVLGTDSTALPTGQPAGEWLPYTTTGKSSEALTVRFKTDAAGTTIYRYNPSLNPPLNTVSGEPVYVVTVTGRQGNSKKTIQAEVVRKPMIPSNARAAVAADFPITITGTGAVCGYNHSASTATNDGDDGRIGAPASTHCQDNELTWGHLPGAWSTSSVSLGGAYDCVGSPDVAENQAGFYSGPWDMFGMGQADFLSFLGTPRTSISSLDGINYIDDDNIPQNRSQDLGLNGGTGEGFLYVDGDLTMNAGTVFRGLIYVEGDLKLNGTAWILGAMVVKGQTTVKINGTATILYSSDAISQALSRSGGQFVTLSWREVN
jgi:Tfp pilus assembly protein PilX